jgi:hypothetical protein
MESRVTCVSREKGEDELPQGFFLDEQTGKRTNQPLGGVREFEHRARTQEIPRSGFGDRD